VPLINAPVLSNLFEYRHKSYTAKTKILLATFLSHSMGQASTNVTKFASEANAFSVIMQSNGHHTIQRHARSPNFVTNRKPVCDFLLVNNTTLYPISRRL